jgi:hypothetical protein
VLGGKNKTLIGRAQTMDFVNGLASTYECQCLCPPVFGEARLLPGSVTGFPDDTQQFTAQERFRNCFNVYGDWYNVSPSRITFSSDYPSVATINSSGLGTAVAPGSTYLRASWQSDGWNWDTEVGWCFYYAAAAACAAFCDVQDCPIPTSETTMSTGWDTIAGSLHKWQQRLLPVTTSFNGRKIYESTPSPGTDGCWFLGSQRDKFDRVTNSPGTFWTVNSVNEWGPDKVGYSPDHVSYYRFDAPRFPCSTSFTQRMEISCGSQKQVYATHELRAGIQMFTVSSGRAAENASRPYPQ